MSALPIHWTYTDGAGLADSISANLDVYMNGSTAISAPSSGTSANNPFAGMLLVGADFGWPGDFNYADSTYGGASGPYGNSTVGVTGITPYYVTQKGMTIERLDMNWWFLQNNGSYTYGSSAPTSGDIVYNVPLDTNYLTTLHLYVDPFIAAGGWVLFSLDGYIAPINPSGGSHPNADDLADVWFRMAQEFGTNSIFTLMNEPTFTQTGTTSSDATYILGIQNAVRTKLRNNGYPTQWLAFQSGVNYTDAATWMTDTDVSGKTSAQVMVPANWDNDPYVLVNMHQYFDRTHSGTVYTGADAEPFPYDGVGYVRDGDSGYQTNGSGSNALQTWARTNGIGGKPIQCIIGECGWEWRPS
jgi:hypothetical protein